MKAEFSHVRIAGVLGVVPGKVSYFDDELCNYSHTQANSLKLKAAMGYDQHRVADAGTTTSDLTCFGLNRLFTEYGVDPASIDAIFFVSQTPDFLLPATSAYIHGQFAFSKETYCIDINDGCCGYIKALYEGSAFLSVTTAQRVLIIAGDVLSAKVSRHDRNSFPLIGDAATITLLEKTAEVSQLEVELYYDGTGYDKLKIPAGGARIECSPATAKLHMDEDGNQRSAEHLVMQGRDVFAFTQTVVPEFMAAFLSNRGLTPQEIDVFLLHQANAFILDRLRLKLGVDKSKVPDLVIRKFGNSSSGTIPMGIATSLPDALSTKVMACGFGVGLSWGAALFELNGLDFCNVIEFSGEEE